MLPVVLDMQLRAFLVCGFGEVALRRIRLLEQAVPSDLRVYAPERCPVLLGALGDVVSVGVPDQEDMRGAVVFISGLEEEAARVLAESARAVGALVNVEDKPSLCDFHMPSIVRRGDVVFTVSTGGRSPALARYLGKDIAARYGAEWGARLDEIAQKRALWRGMGLGPAEVGQRSEAWMDQKGWRG